MTSAATVQLVYVSLATRPLPTSELVTLLQRARAHNATLGVTGVLLHQAGSFFQVLEGEPAVVDALYDKIGKDPRHRHVVLLLRQADVPRNFGDWSMGFIDVGGKAARLPGFRAGMAFSDLVGNPETVTKIVAEFRAGRWSPSVAS